MNDEDREPVQRPLPGAAPGAGPEPDAAGPASKGAEAADDTAVGEAWDDVLARVGELGDAISRWAKSAADDPENRRRLDEVKAGMDDMARQAQETFHDIDETELGRQVRQGAEETGRVVGDAAQRVSDAAAPHVAVIFAGLADAFGRAAAGVDESVRRTKQQASHDSPETPDGPSADETPVEEAPPAGADDEAADGEPVD